MGLKTAKNHTLELQPGHLHHVPGQKGYIPGKSTPNTTGVGLTLFEVAVFPLLPVHHVVKDGNHDIFALQARPVSHLGTGQSFPE